MKENKTRMTAGMLNKALDEAFIRRGLKPLKKGNKTGHAVIVKMPTDTNKDNHQIF